METFIHLKSTCPCVINVNGTQIGYTQKPVDLLSIKTDEKLFIVTVYPIEEFGSSHLCFSTKLFLQDKKLLTNSDNVEIYNFGNNHFEVIFTPPKISTYTSKPATYLKRINENLTAEYFDCAIPKLVLKQERLAFEFLIEQKLHDIKIESFENENRIFTTLYGKTYNNLQFLMVICDFFCNIKIIANKISFDNNKIESISYLNDIANQAVVEQYTIGKNGFNKVDEFLIYENKKPYIEENPNIIPWAFMEAINFENYKLCKYYLSSELNATLDENHIKSFFGNYQKIDWDKYYDGPQTICVFNEKNEKCKKFKFEIEKNKIVNILQLD